MRYSIILIGFLLATFQSVAAEKVIESKKLWPAVFKVDTKVWKGQSELKAKYKLSSDEQFVRRVYLDITGVIPSYEQVIQFLKSRHPNKRANLIESLLNSPGYVSHMSEFFGDLLRDNKESDTRMDQNEFSTWIKDQFRENVKYDKIVYDLIVSEGKSTANGAIGFYMRDRETTILDTASSASKAFLGMRIGCAQCHNHLFDKWTQKEFYEFSAYFGGASAKLDRGGIRAQPLRLARNVVAKTNLDEDVKRILSRLVSVSGAYVSYNQGKKLRYPDDYIYKNASAGAVVAPRVIFDFGPKDVKGKDARETMALWMTSKENRQFSKTMVNRLWKRAFGVGIVEPVDDFKDTTEPLNPELLEALTDIFIELEFDFKAFLSVLYNTEAYQMGVAPGREGLNEKNYAIQGAVMRRMTAEQIWDSVLSLTVGDVSERDESVTDKLASWDKAYMELAHRFRQSGSPKFSSIVRSNGGVSDDEGNVKTEMPALKKYFEDTWGPIIKEFIESHGAQPMTSNGEGMMAMMDKGMMKKVAKKKKGMMAGMMLPKIVSREKRAASSYKSRRAKQILYTFGANDRTSVQAKGSEAPSITQVLELMNGDLAKMISSKNSYVVKRIMQEKSFDARLRVAVVSLYGRMPIGSDRSLASKFIKTLKSKGYKEDQVWANYLIAMLNSPEFIFVL